MPRHFRRTSQGKLRLSGVMGGRGSLVSPTVVPAELQRTASTQSAAPSLRRQNTRRNSGRIRRLSLIRAFGKTPAESIDYEEPLTFAARAILQDTKELTRARRERLFMPIVLVLVGAVAGLMATAVHSLSHRILAAKLTAVFAAEHSSGLLVAGVVYVGAGVSLALGAACLVEFVAPPAAGSGMTSVLLFLNGWHLPDAFTPATLLVKLFGLILVAASGLAVGQEAPLIHVGTIVGSLGFRLASETVLARTVEVHGRGRAWLDLAGCGGGAALSGAFLAPVSGVLFVMEELGTFWSKTLLVRVFVASVSAAAIGRIFRALDSAAGLEALTAPIRYDSLLEQGVGASCALDDAQEITPAEMLIFAVVGLAGGAGGAAFNEGAAWMLTRRARFLSRTAALRLGDVALVALVTGVVVFAAAAAWPCVPFDAEHAPDVLLHHVSTLACGAQPGAGGDDAHRRSLAGGGGGGHADGPAYWNELASLLMAPPLSAAGMLLSVEHAALSAGACALYGTLLLLLALSVLGAIVPAGMLLVQIAVGAAYGRALGVGMGVLWGAPRAQGVYALIGACAFVAGTSHNTIAFVMILIESMNDTTYLIPCIVTMLFALVVSKQLGKPFYETQLEKSGQPFLLQADETAPELNLLTAADVMTSHPTCLHVIERADTLAMMVAHCSHNGFPLVDVVNHGAAGPPPMGTMPEVPAIGPLGSRAAPARVGEHDLRTRYFNGFVTRDRVLTLLADCLELAEEMEREDAEAEAVPTRQGSADIAAPPADHTAAGAAAHAKHAGPAAALSAAMNVAASALHVGGAHGAHAPPQPAPPADLSSLPPLAMSHAESAPGNLGGRGARASVAAPSPAVREAFDHLGLEADDRVVARAARIEIDLRGFSDIVPHAVAGSAPIRVLLHTFLRLGARHVTVVDDRRRVMGIITRTDVTPAALDKLLSGVTEEGRLARALAPHASLHRGLQQLHATTTEQLQRTFTMSSQALTGAAASARPSTRRRRSTDSEGQFGPALAAAVSAADRRAEEIGGTRLSRASAHDEHDEDGWSRARTRPDDDSISRQIGARVARVTD